MTLPVYIASSNMIGQRQRLDAVADNIANVNTAGYKRQIVDFGELVSTKQTQQVGSFSHHIGTQFVFDQGGFQLTDNQLDTAIRGDGFYATNVDGQITYTRNGQFNMDAAGNLVNGQGHPVLDANNGPISIPTDSTTISFTQEGDIVNQNGIVATLGVFSFDNKQALTRTGNGGWIANGQTPILAEGFSIEQGHLETSNVNAVRETVTMTELARRYESTAKMIRQMEQLEESAIQNLSRMPN
jgi:flagellar basal-body rod protein FlgF